jgi:hypothetical protein
MARRIDELCDREYGALFSGLSPREEEAVVEGTRLLAALLRTSAQGKDRGLL